MSATNPVVAFVVVMAVWTVSEYVAKKTKSLLSSLFVASLIFLVGFLTGIFPDDLLASSSLLALAGVVVGFIIVHLGTMISLDDFKKQWRTFLIGASTVLGIGIALWLAALVFGARISGSAADGYAQALDFVVAGTGALSGGTISVIIVQEAALGVGLTAIAIFPVLIAALQGLIGFPLTSIILRKEAARLKGEYRAGNLAAVEAEEEGAAGRSILPAPFRNTPGTLFVVGIVVLVSLGINNLTDGILNTFVVALVFGVLLRTFGVFKPSVLAGIDSLGLMMLAIMILVFGPLATVRGRRPQGAGLPADPRVRLRRRRHRRVLGAGRQAARLQHPDVGRDRAHLALRLPGHDDPVAGGRQGCGGDPRGGRRHRARDPAEDDHRRVLDRHHHLGDRDEHHRRPDRLRLTPASCDLSAVSRHSPGNRRWSHEVELR